MNKRLIAHNVRTINEWRESIENKPNRTEDDEIELNHIEQLERILNRALRAEGN